MAVAKTAALIFLHGLGDTAAGASGAAERPQPSPAASEALTRAAPLPLPPPPHIDQDGAWWRP